MKVKVIYSVWGADGFDEPFSGGVHEIEDVTEEQARSIASAAAAGAVEVLEASKAEQSLLDGHVQSQEDGEAAYAAAQEDGTWQHGNLVTFIATRKARLLYDDQVIAGKGSEGDEALADEKRADYERQIADAEETLAGIEEPS